MGKLLGYREDYDGESLLFYGNGKDEFYVEYKGEKKSVEILYNMVRDGYYNQNVREVPYIVIGRDVYTIDSFTDIDRR